MTKIFAPLVTENREELKSLEDIHLEPRFGRAPVYILFDTNTQEFDIIPNTNHHFGGSDTPVSIVQRANPDYVLAPYLGSKPFRMISTTNIPIVQAIPNESFAEQLHKWDTLHPMTAPPENSPCCTPPQEIFETNT